MNAHQAYLNDPTFHALVQVWAKQEACPLVLAERAQELELSLDVVRCAEWCATYCYLDTGDETRLRARPFDAGDDRFVWTLLDTRREVLRYASQVPASNLCQVPDAYFPPQDRQFSTAVDAILWLLDNWHQTELVK